ncbi:MAG: hypothetical protein JO031_08360 [Ktedonobacteraceae bacterium]|nr:hypothetical protein [Ktedonobacteraceae bacterium]
MNQCLRCNRQCSVTSLFCDNCEALFQEQESPALEESQHVEKNISALATAPQVAVSSPQDDGGDDIARRITSPNPGVPSSGSPQPSVYTVQTNRVEQALHRLSEAARRLAATEPDNQRKPKISRLSPFRDISAEIQRKSTPLPSMHEQKLFSIDDEQSDDLGGNLPDLWPWLNDGDSGEINAESWSNRTDPLISRRFPDSVEAARIEEEDMRRAAAEGLPTFALPTTRKRTSRLRMVFASLTILAILALTIDSILVSVAFLHKNPTQKHVTTNFTGSPVLTLSSSEVIYGQVVTLHLQNFLPSSWVYVTRDVEEPITLLSSKSTSGPDRSIIVVGPNGKADASMSIESNWNPGFHTIEAEDIAMHATAKTSLHIGGGGPTLPPHLVVDTLAIDLGDAPVGADSVRPLSMHNAGSGSITWSASSNQPWLLVAPNQGTFSDGQTISVAGQRANLKPGDYSGTITLTSSTGTTVKVPVDMTTLPLPNTSAPVLQVTPALLSFVAVDGASNPPPFSLSVSNPGAQPLHWSVADQAAPTDATGAFLLASGISTNWLKTDITKGTVAPHGTATIQVSAQSTSLLPGAYTSTLVFNADKGAINNPQSVNVSLTIQPRCSLQVSTNALSFTATANQGSPATQSINLSASSSCSAASTWTATATPLPSWLSVNPTGGQLNGMTSSTATVAVNTNNLPVGTYNATITLTMPQTQNTQSVTVQLTVQPPPPPGAPSMTVSPLNLTFNVMQGQASAQLVSITNTGGSKLYWNQSASVLTNPSMVWFAALPSGGSLDPNQTAQLTVKVRTVLPGGIPVAPGLHSGLITVNGADVNGKNAGGSPQTVTVNLNVLVPCTLSPPTSNALAFSAVQGSSNPPAQMDSLGTNGNCAWPVGWNATSSQPWLNVSPASGSFTAGSQSAAMTVAPTITGLAPGTYTAQITISSNDSGGTQLQGSPQTIPVTLTITGFSVSGTVNACSGSACATPVPLANATLTLTDGSGAHFTATADANGKYSFTGVALGPCTISASGSNGTTHYTGNASLSITGDAPSVVINTF